MSSASLLTRWMLSAAALLSALGCAEQSPFPTATLSGEVTLEGQPLASGSISFLPTASGQGAAAGAVIENGRYRCDRVPIGKVQVQFAASRDTGKVDENGWKLFESVIPAAAADTEIEVPPGDSQRDFPLTSSANAEQSALR